MKVATTKPISRAIWMLRRVSSSARSRLRRAEPELAPVEVRRHQVHLVAVLLAQRHQRLEHLLGLGDLAAERQQIPEQQQRDHADLVAPRRRATRRSRSPGAASRSPPSGSELNRQRARPCPTSSDARKQLASSGVQRPPAPSPPGSPARATCGIRPSSRSAVAASRMISTSAARSARRRAPLQRRHQIVDGVVPAHAVAHQRRGRAARSSAGAGRSRRAGRAPGCRAISAST